MITVDVDGAVASWSPAEGFTGDPDLVASAVEAAGGHYPVAWGRLPEPQIAGSDTPLAALSALMYLRPGRTRILEWPDFLCRWWTENWIDCGASAA